MMMMMRVRKGGNWMVNGREGLSRRGEWRRGRKEGEGFARPVLRSFRCLCIAHWCVNELLLWYVSFMSIGCMYHEYDRRTGDVDIKRRRRSFFTDLDSQWPNLWRSEVWAGVRNVAALQMKCLKWSVYGVTVTFMSTGYMYHRYDLRTGDWMMILISTGDVAVSSPFNTKHTYVCVFVCVCVCSIRRLSGTQWRLKLRVWSTACWLWTQRNVWPPPRRWGIRGSALVLVCVLSC